MPDSARAVPRTRSTPFARILLPLLIMPAGWGPGSASAQQDAPSPLIPAGSSSDLPRVEPNGNTRRAGTLADGVRTIDLEVRRADWRIEGAAGPGLRVAAIGETGRAPEIPAPLIRVDSGTRLAVTVRNRLPVAVTVFGLHPRPAEAVDSVIVEPGGTEAVEFDVGTPGTYLYWMRAGPAPDPDSPEADWEGEQLAGAFVVDSPGTAAEDRILVMNIFSRPEVPSNPDGDWFEALTVNGLSWPFTERFEFEVGDEVRWRVVNASIRNHPMHLHGFYYSVLSRGNPVADEIYAEADRRLVVTETMRGRTTMMMEWTATRPGRWLFHCHLSFHVTSHFRLPGAVEADPEHAHSHMAGLVTGIEVAPGPTDLIHRGEPRAIDLYAVELPDPGHDSARYGFAVGEGSGAVPGPTLVLQQYQPVDVTVYNRLPVPTGVHWHGLELDSWADGVPDWSASDGKVSPVIHPGESFTYRLSLQRPGTFVYHTHLDDVDQLRRGLYGPMLVLPEGEVYNPGTDHVLTLGWNTSQPMSLAGIDLNGGHEQPDGAAKVGERHRFRVINIAPAGNITAWITRDDEVIPVTLHAKDGADLPEHQRMDVDYLPRLFVGEVADFVWTPDAPGTYEVHVGYGTAPGRNLVQRFVVTR